MARLDKVLAGTQITDEYTYRTGSTALGLLHDAFLASTVVVRTAEGGGGTLLELTTDYTLSAEDSRLTTEAGATVYTKLAVVNGTYQNTPLYISYKCVADYNRASDINNRGRKIGLEAYYVSSDLIRVNPGSVEVNDVMVTKTTSTDFTTGATNFPGAGSWAYICSDIAGTLSLEAATGTAAQRPTDDCFQWSGGGVGFLDLGKQGYYYDPARRIIGAIHKVNATTWYIIGQGEGIIESGRNASGYYQITSDGTMVQDGTGGNTVALSVDDLVTCTFPVNFVGDYKIVFMPQGGSFYVNAAASVSPWITFVKNAGSYRLDYACGLSKNRSVVGDWYAIGRWRA